MNPSVRRALKIGCILALLPLAAARAQESGEPEAGAETTGTPYQMQITNSSRQVWLLANEGSGMGGHVFKDIKTETSALKLRDVAAKKDIGMGDYPVPAKTTLTLKCQPAGKNRVARFTLKDRAGNKATFCLLSRAGVMKLFLEKAQLIDDMDIDIFKTNQPEAGGLVISNPAD